VTADAACSLTGRLESDRAQGNSSTILVTHWASADSHTVHSPTASACTDHTERHLPYEITPGPPVSSHTIHSPAASAYNTHRTSPAIWDHTLSIYKLPNCPLAVSAYNIQSVTCHMKSHSVTYHPRQVNAPCLNASKTSRLNWCGWLIILGAFNKFQHCSSQ